MKLGSEVLFLSLSDVTSLLTMGEALAAVEGAFALHGRKEVEMPPKVYLEFPPFEGDLRAMPAYLKAPVSAAGVKIVNSNPKNPQRGLPAVAGIMVYVDPSSGLVLGLFEAGSLTSIRTGAAGGIAAKYLARRDSKEVGLIGCGRQARTQLEALLPFFKIEKVLVWGQTKEESETFCKQNRDLHPNLIPCREVEPAARVDIIVTTTPVRTPLIKADWIKPGAHINAIGADAPGKQELQTEILKKARVVVDEWRQASHAGEINVPVSRGEYTEKDIVGQLGEVVIGEKPGRTSETDITVFDSTGLAIQDVAVSKLIFEKAIKLKKGQVLNLHG